MTITYDERELEKRYIKNMESFKKYSPLIYNKLLTESDPSYSLELKKDNLNISKNNKLIYPNINTLEYHKELLNHYYQRANANLIKAESSVVTIDDSLTAFGVETQSLAAHLQLSNNYVNIFNKYPDITKTSPNHKEIYAMVIFGIGLGYQIPDLIIKYHIQQLILVDVNIEMLRASLYTLEWEGIFQYFNQEGKHRKIEFMINSDPLMLERFLVSYFVLDTPLAYYNLAQFVTYDDPLLQETIKRFTKNIEVSTGAKQGFYDDEKWSLQHTINNLRNQIPILSKTSIKVDKEVPVFLVANGPSFDLYKDYIKEHRDKGILISAGSALATLYKNGIKPDFHIGIERNIITYDGIRSFAPKSYLKDITFIAMNSIHPRVFTLFKKSYLFLKPGDAGTAFINDKESYPVLHYSNPTVSNASLAVTLELGFKNILFFGMDFGYKYRDKHHSKSSVYHDKNSAFFKETYTDEIGTKGVNGGMVYTTEFYNNSRKNIEALIEDIVKENKNDSYKIYNYSEGAHIEGTIYANHDTEYLKSVEPLTKNQYENLLVTIDKNFTLYNKDIIIQHEKIKNSIDKIIEIINMCKIENITAFTYLRLSKFIFDAIKAVFLDQPYVFHMLRGTIVVLMSKIYTYISYQEQDKKSTQFIYDSVNTLIDFLEGVKGQVPSWDMVIDLPYYIGPKKFTYIED